MNIRKCLIFLMFFSNLIYSNIKSEVSSFIISAILNMISKELTKKNADKSLTFSTEEELKNFYSLIDNYLPADDRLTLKSESGVVTYKKNCTNIYKYYLPLLAIDLFSVFVFKPKNMLTFIGKVAYNLDAIAKVTFPNLSFENSLSQLTKKLYPSSLFMQEYIKTIYKKNKETEKIKFLEKNKRFFPLLKQLSNIIKEIEEIIKINDGIDLNKNKKQCEKNHFIRFFNAKTNKEEDALKNKIEELEKEKTILMETLNSERLINYNRLYCILKNKIQSIEKKNLFNKSLLTELGNSLPKIKIVRDQKDEENNLLKKSTQYINFLENIVAKNEIINAKNEIAIYLFKEKCIPIPSFLFNKNFLIKSIKNLNFLEKHYDNIEKSYDEHLKKLNKIIENFKNL